MSAGGRVARRALRRWSWRLYRREWRQQVLVLALITVAVAASVFGATAAYNLTDTRVAEFGSANHRFENAVARPEDIAPYIAEAEEWFGTIEVIGHQAVADPGHDRHRRAPLDRARRRVLRPHGLGRSRAAARRRSARSPSPTAPPPTSTPRLGDQVDVGRGSYEVVGIVENPADLDDEYALVLPDGQTPESITLLVDADREQADRVPAQRHARSGLHRVAGGRPSRPPPPSPCSSSPPSPWSSCASWPGRASPPSPTAACASSACSPPPAPRPRHLRRAMVANGTAVGLTAAVVGTGAGLLAWLASASALEPAAAHRIDPLEHSAVAAGRRHRARRGHRHRGRVVAGPRRRPDADHRRRRRPTAGATPGPPLARRRRGPLRLRRPRHRRGHRPQLRRDEPRSSSSPASSPCPSPCSSPAHRCCGRWRGSPAASPSAPAWPCATWPGSSRARPPPSARSPSPSASRSRSSSSPPPTCPTPTRATCRPTSWSSGPTRRARSAGCRCPSSATPR